MADTLSLEYVPSSPAGPSGGRLQIEPGRLAVVRKGVFGTKAALARSRGELRGWERGTAADLAERTWMSAGAQLALQRAATVNPDAEFLAVRFEDPAGLNDVWLFRGPVAEMDLAIAALSSGGVISRAPAAAGAGAGAPGSLGGGGLADEADRLSETLARRRPSATVRWGWMLVTLAIFGAIGWASFSWIPGFIDDVKTAFEVPAVPPPQPPQVPPSPPQDEPARPFTVEQAFRGLGSPSVGQAGVTQAGRHRRSGRAVIIPLRHQGRPLQLIVFPDPQTARSAKGPRDQLLANLLLRGNGAAKVAPVVFVAVANPQAPVI